MNNILSDIWSILLFFAVVFPERSQSDISSIPKIFLQANLDLSHVDTFKAVYPFSKDPQSPVSNGESVKIMQRSEKLLQEKVGTITIIVSCRSLQEFSPVSIGIKQSSCIVSWVPYHIYHYMRYTWDGPAVGCQTVYAVCASYATWITYSYL
jgi:hypothetical protein